MVVKGFSNIVCKAPVLVVRRRRTKEKVIIRATIVTSSNRRENCRRASDVN